MKTVEGNPHLITVVTANLEAVGAPTPIAFIHGDATVVPPLGTTGMGGTWSLCFP